MVYIVISNTVVWLDNGTTVPWWSLGSVVVSVLMVYIANKQYSCMTGQLHVCTLIVSGKCSCQCVDGLHCNKQYSCTTGQWHICTLIVSGQRSCQCVDGLHCNKQYSCMTGQWHVCTLIVSGKWASQSMLIFTMQYAFHMYNRHCITQVLTVYITDAI